MRRFEESSLSPALLPLARERGGEPAYLAPHHCVAAQRIQALFERSRLTPRTIMHYGPRTGGTRAAQGAGEISDMAADARKMLARLHDSLPPDCMDVVLDVCGFEKGLQQIESERGWPRRSAKLVLRIGLDAVARFYGLDAAAKGAEVGRARVWRPDAARPDEIG